MVRSLGDNHQHGKKVRRDIADFVCVSIQDGEFNENCIQQLNNLQ